MLTLLAVRRLRREILTVFRGDSTDKEGLFLDLEDSFVWLSSSTMSVSVNLRTFFDLNDPGKGRYDTVYPHYGWFQRKENK